MWRRVIVPLPVRVALACQAEAVGPDILAPVPGPRHLYAEATALASVR